MSASAKKNGAPGKTRRQQSVKVSAGNNSRSAADKASPASQIGSALKTPVIVTRHKSSHGPVSKSVALKDGHIVSTACCQIYAGRSSRIALADWRDFAALIDRTPLDAAWSLGAMRDDRADKCELYTDTAQTRDLMDRRADVVTRTRDLIDYRPDKPAFMLLDFDAGGMTPTNRKRLDELGGWFGAMKFLLPGFEEAGYIWRPSTSANIFRSGDDRPLKETQNLHCYLLAQDGGDAERFLKTLLDRAWLHGFGWIKISRDGKALERGIVDSSTWGGERLNFEGGPDLGPGLEQRGRNARVHDGAPYDTRRLLDLIAEEQREVLRLKNEAKSGLGLKTRMEKAARQFKAEKVGELVKRGVPKEKAERAVDALMGGVRKLMPDMPLELDDGRCVTVKDILLDPQKYAGSTMPDPIEGRERGRNVAFVMEQGNAIWSFVHGETLYFFAHDFDTLKAAIEKAPEREAANTLGKLIRDAVLTEAERAALVKLAKQRDGISVADVRKIVKDAEREQRSEEREKECAASVRPRILLTPGAIVDVVLEVDKALAAANDVKIFRRDRDLVRPTEIELPASDNRKTTVIGLKTFKAHDLSVAMAVAADFYKPGKDDPVLTDPPASLAQKVIELTDRLHLPTLAGVISCPTLRLDGSVLSAPGYDAATGMFHFADKAVDLISLNDEPNRDDALAAAALLEELLAEFPFVDAVDRAVALSAIITAATRSMFSVVPAHAYTAPEAGTGKSFLSDLCSLIVSGKDCPVLAACENEHELEKALSASLLSGCGLVNLDNMVAPLTGGVLCQTVSQPHIEVRPFGQNDKKITVVNRTTIQTNGNNLTVRDDMTRRVLIGRLDAKVERPELRVFKRNPRAMILANRGKYVAACLTIVRAYLLAGRPGKLPPLASFETWSDNVRSALSWLGQPDVASTLNVARETDPELAKLKTFLTAIRVHYGSGPAHSFFLRQACDDAKAGNFAGAPSKAIQLATALSEIAGGRGAEKFDVNRLGYWLRARKGKIVDGYRLVAETDGHTKIAKWRAEDVGNPNQNRQAGDVT